MGRFDSLKENTFSPSPSSSSSRREKNSRMRNNQQNSEPIRRNNSSDTRFRSWNTVIPTNKSNSRLTQAKTINLNNSTEEDFPDLVKQDKDDTSDKGTDKNNIVTGSSWQNAMKQREEEENRNKEGSINQYDPKYWRGATWTGPMIIRQENYPDSWYKYMEKAVSGHASSYLFPFRETEYSRDGANWYPSWNETFSEEQLQRMEYEEEEEYKMEQYRILEEYKNTLEEEAEKYYDDFGELNGYANAYLERIEYEKYAEQFNNEIPLEDNEDELDSDDYLEDDN